MGNMIKLNQRNAVKTSEIELIGLGLFGKNWQSQICEQLKNKQGGKLSRQTLFAWHDRDSLPIIYKPELRRLAETRMKQMRQAYAMLNDDQWSIEEAIAQFLKKNASLLNPLSTIYTRVFFGYDKYRNFNLRVELTLDEPEVEPETKGDDVKSPQWSGFTFSLNNFVSELIDLKENLLKFIQSLDVYYDEKLNTPDKVRYNLAEINISHFSCFKPLSAKIRKK